ncbi:MAG: hypothetical protein DRQ42_06945 [Gammaproteobacteria bacterium]|nr:MAG: hypothetical protein DRQ42_06945 [Gammaproteobacteria bacterium]
MGIGAAIAIGVSAVGGAVSRNKQADAQEDARNQQMMLDAQAKQQEKDILAEQARQDGEKQTIEFGVQDDDEDEEMGSYNDFIEPKKQTALGGTKAPSGLGL